MKNLHAFLILSMIGIAVYANSFQNDFVWDDEYLITNNTHVQAPSLTDALQFFKDSLGKYGQDKNNFYRPLQELSYMLDYKVWGLNPPGFHLTNLILHILTAFILFLIVKEISGNKTAAMISSSIYMVHPLNVEAVAYMAGRSEPLMAVFFLLTFYFYIKGNKIAPVFFVLALLSKEVALMLPVILIFYDAVFKTREKIRAVSYVPYAAILAIYGALRTSVLNFKYPVAAIPEGVGFYERLLTSFRALQEYFRLIVSPFDLHMERVLSYSKSLLEKEVLMSCAALAAVFMIILLLRKRNKLAFFGMGWFFITLFPLSNIPFALNATLAEHWLYMPLMGICMAYGAIFPSGISLEISRRRIYQSAFLILSACILVYFSAVTVNQNIKWRDSETLYKYTLRYAADSPRVHYNLGNTYRETGNLKEAEQEYKTAITLDPSLNSAYFNLGLTYIGMRDIDNAIREFQKSIELSPSHYKSYAMLGLAYKEKGLLDGAIEEYNKALEINPGYAEARNNLGDAYFTKKMYKEAEEEFRKALIIDSKYADAWNNLGSSLMMQGKSGEAVAAWKRSLEINPDQPRIKEYISRNIN